MFSAFDLISDTVKNKIHQSYIQTAYNVEEIGQNIFLSFLTSPPPKKNLLKNWGQTELFWLKNKEIKNVPNYL